MINKLSNKHKSIYQNKRKDKYIIMMSFNIKWRQKIYHCYKRNQRERIQNQKLSVFQYRLMKTHHKYKQLYKNSKKKKKLSLQSKRKTVFTLKKNTLKALRKKQKKFKGMLKFLNKKYKKRIYSSNSQNTMKK